MVIGSLLCERIYVLFGGNGEALVDALPHLVRTLKWRALSQEKFLDVMTLITGSQSWLSPHVCVTQSTPSTKFIYFRGQSAVTPNPSATSSSK